MKRNAMDWTDPFGLQKKLKTYTQPKERNPEELTAFHEQDFQFVQNGLLQLIINTKFSEAETYFSKGRRWFFHFIYCCDF